LFHKRSLFNEPSVILKLASSWISMKKPLIYRFWLLSSVFGLFLLENNLQ
jgi:hypothetical protein